MNSTNKNLDFAKIAQQINADFVEHRKNIAKLHFSTSAAPLDKVFESYNQQLKEKAAETTPKKHDPTIGDFESAFKAFEVCPPNLAGPKSNKDARRLNCSVQKGSSVDGNTTMKPVNNIVDPEELIAWKDTKTLNEIHRDFQKYVRNLNTLVEEKKQQNVVAMESTVKLQSLNAFAEKLEKCLPTAEVQEQAFNASEVNALQQLLTELKDMMFVHQNEQIFSEDETALTSNACLDSHLEVLAHAFRAISGHKPIN